MKRIVLFLAVLLFATANAQAQNIGKCGWGSKVFHGQKGILPQTLAVTTNGTSGNQTFAITSGTSGCTRDGVIKSSWKTAAYIDANSTKLARDISRGQGEALDAFAGLLGMEGADKQLFASTAQQNFNSIFPSQEVTSVDVAKSLKMMMASTAGLEKYSELI